MITSSAWPRFLLTSILFIFTTGSGGQEPERANAGIISGIVLDEGGNPVGGAEVDADDIVPSAAVSKALRLALTDNSGAFIFNPVKFGSYKLYALKPEVGYPDTKFEIYANSYRKTMATISATAPNMTVTIMIGPKAGMLRLFVVDKTTHETIHNPTLVLRRPDTGVWISTNETSESLLLIPPGIPTELTVQANGYRSWSNYDAKSPKSAALLKINSGEKIQMTIELESAP